MSRDQYAVVWRDPEGVDRALYGGDAKKAARRAKRMWEQHPEYTAVWTVPIANLLLAHYQRFSED